MKAFFDHLFAPLRWLAGIFEEGTAQSSTRVAALAYVAASIKYAMRTVPPPDHYVLGTLVVTAAAFCGIKLAKDVKLAKIAADTGTATAESS